MISWNRRIESFILRGIVAVLLPLAVCEAAGDSLPIGRAGRSPAGVARATLRALYVDLEFEPAPLEGGRAIEAALDEAARNDAALEGFRIRFDFVHYADLSAERLASPRYSLIVLSPQSTPWSRYAREQPELFLSTRTLLKESIRAGTPLLGICGGHQFLALIFDGKTDMMDPEFRGRRLDEYPDEALAESGVVELTVMAPDPLLEGVPSPEGRFLATEVHREEVSNIQDPLINLARSRMCRIQILRVRGRPVYGLQFHPEADTSDGSGQKILTNFLRMVVRGRSPRGAEPLPVR